ncbi:CatB-related O-acetyltransferase [Nocardia sp. NBC_01503]|uniref:CatB-related O-acetyltransferase n=1 Tax=Nocardia sp. NBC_01503 TaxID=2975997 RepID=UPI002E7BB7F4|nr:CatB-related O-acetyltransferase [Nocardia sp. NBC_01503]WTL29532.1 CatB-related O-acetyltransferase [Nocardia sp. NBC_01503]
MSAPNRTEPEQAGWRWGPRSGATGAPDPTRIHPLPTHPRVVFLRPLITADHISVGEYTYYDNFDHPENFERECVRYDYRPDRLIIGRYCALASGVRFLMSGANHRMDGVSTFPFAIFDGDWAAATHDLINLEAMPGKGDTVVGNDVWLGYGAIVLPGIRIGHGAIVAAGSVVSADIPDYGVVAGNPARLIRRRFTDEEIALLLRLAWWDWPAEAVTRHARILMAGSPRQLADAAETSGLMPPASTKQ